MSARDRNAGAFAGFAVDNDCLGVCNFDQMLWN